MEISIRRCCFNEAGADCPGMLAGDLAAGFNEAGADCPGMPLTGVRLARKESQASMRPGQTAPECFGSDRLAVKAVEASMRPGQTAPECIIPRYPTI